MGGVFGHMSHIYDNPYMTFGQIKEIMQAASAGELQGTEKTDGQNLFVSYNVQDGTVRAARNKGNIKAGGMTPAELLAKFEGRGALTDAFVNSFYAFEEAVESLSNEEQLELFGPDTNIYYNAEVMDPGSANVINYDKKTFLIHRAGHAAYDRETGKPIPDKSGKDFGEEQAAKLQAALERTQDKISKRDFKVEVNAIRNLEGLGNDEDLMIALGRLDQFMSDVGVGDNDSIGTYIVKSLDKLISEQIPELNRDAKKLLIKRIMEDYYGVIEGEAGPKKVRGLETRQILKVADDPEVNDRVKHLASNYPQYLKKVIFPIEDIIHDFAVEMLRSLQSAFVLDSDEELERQRAEVDKAIKAIEASGNEEAMEILKVQMEKLKNIEGVSSAAEGFVFDYDGNTYKFTGGFAPMNQILGLFKYGRKGIPALAEDVHWALNEKKSHKRKRKPPTGLAGYVDFTMNENLDKRVVAIYPGRFQPMGRHHFQTYQKIVDEYGLENTFIVTSNKTGPRSPLNFDQKKSIMMKHGVPESQIVQASNPYAAKEVLQNFDPENTSVVYLVGAKDMAESPRFSNLDGVRKDGAPAYLKTLVADDELFGFDEHGYVGVAPHVSIDIPGFGEMSGTALRQALKGADPETFETIMGWFDEGVYELLQGVLQELSAVGGVSSSGIAGYSLPLGAKPRYPDVVGSEKKKKRHPKNFIAEEELVNEVVDYLLGISVG